MLSIRSNLLILSMLACAAAVVPVIAQETSPATSPAGVIASQGGASVTLADIDAFAARMPADKRAGFFNSPTRIQGVITNLLLQKQLAAEARKAGIEHNPEVARQVALATDEALANARMQQFKDSLKAPNVDELAHEEYQAHKEDYVVPGELVVKQVLISTKSHSDAEARALAATVEKEARAHPDQFDALIDKYSEDPSKAQNHGLLEQVGEKGKYIAAFANAAKALAKPGDISPIVRTQFGFHVIELVKRTPDHQQGFDEVKAQIISRLSKKFVDAAVKEHSDVLRNKPMTADSALVASLRTRYGKAQGSPDQPPAAAQ